MIGLIKTLLILFFIYFIWKIFRFLFIPLFLTRFVNHQQHNFGGRSYNKQNEGDVTIQTNSNKSKKVGGDVGEYVSYEEVKD